MTFVFFQSKRFFANNYFQYWFTAEFVQADYVNSEDYQNMPLYDKQICLRFQLTGYYIDTLYFKFVPEWFIANMETIICNIFKAFVRFFMHNGMSKSNN